MMRVKAKEKEKNREEAAKAKETRRTRWNKWFRSESNHEDAEKHQATM